MDFPNLVRELVKDIECQDPFSKKFADHHLRGWVPLIATLKPSWNSSNFTAFTEVLFGLICSTPQHGLSEIESIQFNCRFTLEVVSSSLWECIQPESYTPLLRLINQIQTDEEQFICRTLLFEFFLEHLKSGGIQSPVLNWIMNFIIVECASFFSEFPGTTEAREEFLISLKRISFISGYDNIELKGLVDQCIALLDDGDPLDYVQKTIQKSLSIRLRDSISELEQLVNTPTRVQQTAWHLSRILTSRDIHDCAPLRLLIQYYVGEFPDQLHPTLNYLKALGIFSCRDVEKLQSPRWLSEFCQSPFDLTTFEVDLDTGMRPMEEEGFDNWIDFKDLRNIWTADSNPAILSSNDESNLRLVVVEIGEMLCNSLSHRMYTRLLSTLGTISVHLLTYTQNTNNIEKARELSRLLLDVWIHSIQYSNSIFHKLGEYFEFERYFKMACGTFIWTWDFNLSVSINTDEHFVLLLNRLIQLYEYYKKHMMSSHASLLASLINKLAMESPLMILKREAAVKRLIESYPDLLWLMHKRLENL